MPPKLYGGIERIIDLLIRGLVQQGHEVTLFGNRESRVPCALLPYPGASSVGYADTIRNMMFIARGVRSGRFDLVHSFGRIAYLLPLLPGSLPKLMTYQRAVTPSSVRWGHRLSRGTLRFSAISKQMMEPVKGLARWYLVYNGVPMAAYDFVPKVAPDAPLVFLGRIEHIKGAHLAIDIARRARRALVIAGNIPAGHEHYFEEKVRPFVDRDGIRYVGPLDDRRKNELLGGAAALLMPILWDEPFGIVMAEALACGTPVLGLRRGSVPEVVADGVTGYVRDNVEELVRSVSALAGLERRACRDRAERLFSDTAVVNGYLSVYRELIG